MTFLDNAKQAFKGQPVLNRLIIVNVAVFVLMITLNLLLGWSALYPKSGLGFTDYLAFRAKPGYILTHPWSVVTHMFAHGGFRHLLYNMLYLFFLGRIFLTFFNSRKLLSTYFLGGWVGAIFLIIYDYASPTGDPNVPAVGASAAIMAIILASAVYKPKMILNLFGIFPVPLWLIAAVIVLGDYAALQGTTNIGGHIAHLGGATYGAVFGWQMKENGRFPIADRFERFLHRVFNWNPFKRGPKMRVVRDDFDPRQRRKTDEEFNASKKATEERVNAILDKISKRGWDSLSKAEKEFLNKQSGSR